MSEEINDDPAAFLPPGRHDYCRHQLGMIRFRERGSPTRRFN